MNTRLTIHHFIIWKLCRGCIWGFQVGYGENDNVKKIFLLNFVAAMSVSIPATIFENHNALMLLATSNLWALLWSSPCQVHWRTIGWMMVGQLLSNQLWCAVGLSCCWWFDQRRRGSCETFRSFDQRALLCGENRKPWLLLLVCSLNIVVWQKESLWKSPILKSLSPVKSHPSWPHLAFNYILTNFSTKDPSKQNTNTTI